MREHDTEEVPCRTKELLSKPADSLTMEEAKTLLAEEEERGRQRRKRKGRIRELEEVRAQLAEKVCAALKVDHSF